jgi:SAM-dependent methyltransferase
VSEHVGREPGAEGEESTPAKPARRSTRFTGERLHDTVATDAGDASGVVDLFAVDLARHRAAYAFAAATWLERRRDRPAQRGRILDLGSGAGYGTASLARLGVPVVGVDRERPDASSRGSDARFVAGDVGRLPFTARSFELVVSFQVIEHLRDPRPYLAELARVLSPDGAALLTTPNRTTSDGLNPYHEREYSSGELQELLAQAFGRVEVLGVATSDSVEPYFAARRRTLARVARLDLLGLRQRLPRALRLWLFARAAILVRRALRRGGTLVAASVEDFPVGPLGPTTLDLLAVCERPRR